jgi:hypothetical protein
MHFCIREKTIVIPIFCVPVCLPYPKAYYLTIYTDMIVGTMLLVSDVTILIYNSIQNLIKDYSVQVSDGTLLSSIIAELTYDCWNRIILTCLLIYLSFALFKESRFGIYEQSYRNKLKIWLVTKVLCWAFIITSWAVFLNWNYDSIIFQFKVCIWLILAVDLWMIVLSVFGFISGTKMSLGKEDWEILKKMKNESIRKMIDEEYQLDTDNDLDMCEYGDDSHFEPGPGRLGGESWRNESRGTIGNSGL